MGRIKRHRVVPIRYSTSKDWNDVKIVVFILSLLIGANIYYFKEGVNIFLFNLFLVDNHNTDDSHTQNGVYQKQ